MHLKDKKGAGPILQKTSEVLIVLKTLSTCLFLITLLSAGAQAEMYFMGEGVRQNTTLSTFDSYKMVHHAESTERLLAPHIGRTLDLTMLTDFGLLFTKARMVEALEQALSANMVDGEMGAFSGEINRFKKALLGLPIGNGSQLRFQHVPGTGLQIYMSGRLVFRSSDQNFSMKICSIWLGRAHPDANNRENLELLIENLWRNKH